MRNRISCSAQELGQLDPDMVQSVVGGQVFKIGNQYFSDQREPRPTNPITLKKIYRGQTRIIFP